MQDIPGLEGLYAATKDGRIWSYPKQWKNNRGATNGHNGKFLKPGITKQGYYQVSVKIGDKFISHRVHRLVALAYLPNPRKLPEVNHKDNDRLNNHVINLEWCVGYHNLAQRNQTAGYRKDPQARFNEMIDDDIPVDAALYSLS